MQKANRAWLRTCTCDVCLDLATLLTALLWLSVYFWSGFQMSFAQVYSVSVAPVWLEHFNDENDDDLASNLSSS